MDERLREAWTTIIQAEDYDAHMRAVGQAQANAELIRELFEERPPASGTSILFAGAGTGQMFDFIAPDFLNPFQTTFTDLNAQYLEKLRLRLIETSGIQFKTVLDDIEHTELSGGFSLTIAVLLLEHVDWRKAIAALCKLSTERVFVILQENPPEMATAMRRDLPRVGSMEIFKRIDSHLIPAAMIEAEFANHNFRLVCTTRREVPDRKQMVAQEYARVEQASV